MLTTTRAPAVTSRGRSSRIHASTPGPWNLTGINVLTTADHHVLDPADDRQVAVVVHRCQIAGVHPARGVNGLCRLVRLLPVPEHHAVAPGTQLPRLTAGDRPAGNGVDNLDLKMRHDPSYGPGPTSKIIIHAGHRRNRRGLGHPIGDGDL